MNDEADTWKRIAAALFRRLLLQGAATGVLLEKAELDLAQITRCDWESDDADRILVTFERSGGS